MKPSRLNKHLMEIHPDKADMDRPFFQALKDQHGRRTVSSLFAKNTSQNDSGLIASYKISLLIAKCGQPFSTFFAYPQEKSIPISNILACATDGAPAMVGRYHEFTALLKEQLQGNDITLVKSKAVIHSLTSRLDLHRQSIGRRHFPQLAKVSEALTDDLLLVYTDHLRMVKADMEINFRDLLNLDVPSWVVQPFQTDVIECEPAIQEHLVDIQCPGYFSHLWLVQHVGQICPAVSGSLAKDQAADFCFSNNISR
ncbi:unnamed protein product [Leuciscus chuanchicus]